jgi:hypothetical protein
MMISRALVAGALVVAGAVTAIAAPFPRPMGMTPGFAPWHGGDHYGFHGGWDHHHGGLAIGAFGPLYDASGGYAEAPAPSIWIAPITPITLTVTNNVAPSPSWSEGPRLIVLGRRVPPRQPLPLVIYGDPGA